MFRLGFEYKRFYRRNIRFDRVSADFGDRQSIERLRRQNTNGFIGYDK